MSADRPNVVVLLIDQLSAKVLSTYGGRFVPTPNIDRLAEESVVLDQCISTCPVCTAFRGMMLTGRHTQTTGHTMNFVRTRHSEISVADAFARAGYRTGYVGKWHLHTGAFPAQNVPDYVPEGRDRLGFEYWRAYNQHTLYTDGFYHGVEGQAWRASRWEGYETDALAGFGDEFVGRCGEDPFFLVVSPQPPHWTPQRPWAPPHCYDRLQSPIEPPDCLSGERADEYCELFRHYLAMTIAVDDMVGRMLEDLRGRGKLDDTLFVFTSDHGNQAFSAGRGTDFFAKKLPTEACLKVPAMLRLPGRLEPGRRCDALFSPVDWFPSLCGMCGVKTPASVEGLDLSGTWQGEEGPRDALLTMNFTAAYDYLRNGAEWRGVRTRDHIYARWLDGTTELYDIARDPDQRRNLCDEPEHQTVRQDLERRMQQLMAERNDELVPCESYASWYDHQRRVVRNVFGPLPHPESEPDWSLFD